VVVAAVRRGLAEPRADVVLDGGRLTIDWRTEASGGDGHVWMTGPVATAYAGAIDPDLLVEV
jgi:diaminopimelate epimerase